MLFGKQKTAKGASAPAPSAHPSAKCWTEILSCGAGLEKLSRCSRSGSYRIDGVQICTVAPWVLGMEGRMFGWKCWVGWELFIKIFCWPGSTWLWFEPFFYGNFVDLKSDLYKPSPVPTNNLSPHRTSYPTQNPRLRESKRKSELYSYDNFPTWNTRRIFQRPPHTTKFPFNTEPRGCQGTGDVPWRSSYAPSVKNPPDKRQKIKKVETNIYLTL